MKAESHEAGPLREERCLACQRLIYWHGAWQDRPKCPRCGHDPRAWGREGETGRQGDGATGGNREDQDAL